MNLNKGKEGGTAEDCSALQQYFEVVSTVVRYRSIGWSSVVNV